MASRRTTIAGMMLGQVGRLFMGHALGCRCSLCGGLDGDAHRLAEGLEAVANGPRAQAPVSPAPSPPDAPKAPRTPAAPQLGPGITAEVVGPNGRQTIVLRPVTRPARKPRSKR